MGGAAAIGGFPALVGGRVAQAPDRSAQVGSAAAGSVVARVRAATGPAAVLAVPVLAGVVWQLVIWRLWGALPVRSGSATNLNGAPVLGVFTSLLDGLPGFPTAALPDALVGVTVFAERVAVLALFGYAGLTVLRRRGRLVAGEGLAWGLSVALALSIRGWATDVQFLRAANEAIGMSVLIALSDDRRAGRWAGALAAAMVVCIALEYTVRQ